MAQTKIERANLATTGTPDGSKFLRDDMAWSSAAAGFAAVTFYTDTSGDTWSKSTNNPTKIVVEVIAGGGGSGAGAHSGGSGGAGAYAMAYIDVSDIATATVTVGAGVFMKEKGNG